MKQIGTLILLVSTIPTMPSRRMEDFQGENKIFCNKMYRIFYFSFIIQVA